MDGIVGGGGLTTTTTISSMSANNNNFDIDFMEQLLDVGAWWSSQSSFSHGSRFIQPVINSPTSNSVITSPTTSPPISPNFPFDQANFFMNPFSQHQNNHYIGNKLTQNQIWPVLSCNNYPATPTSTPSPHKTGEENPGRRRGRSSTSFEDQNPTTVHPAVVEYNTIWIPPPVSISTHPNPLLLTTVEERLTRAIWHFQALMISQENKFNKEVLVQIWVPVRKGAKTLLTTAEQPHFYHPPSKPLLSYRNVSEKYEFSANVDDDKDDVDVVRGPRYSLGLPGRVFLGKVPEWTPDVRFFKQEEYPRVTYAQLCDVRGSIALPVFERGSNEKRPCLGVIEIVSTAQKIHYRSEVETVCRALEAVDLQSSDILFPSKKKDGTQEPCTQELFELFGILRTVCDKHGLPLGQTWSPCTQQLTKSTTTTTTTSSSGCWHSNSGSKPHHCLSTITSACYIRDQQVLGFHQACTEHHLYKGQGLVGNAIMTNQPCFATDLTAYSNVDYPLSHHAKIFGVHGSVALHIQCHNSNNGLLVSSACDDYVLELLLPLNIQDSGLTFHMKVLESLSMAVQGSRSFRLVEAAGGPAKEIAFFPSNNETLLSLSNGRDNYGGDEHNARGLQLQSGAGGGGCFSKSMCHEERSWISELIESQKKGKEVAISLGYSGEEPKEEFKLTWSDDNEMDSLRGGIFADHSGFGSSSSKELQSTEGGEDGSNSYGGGNKRLGAKKKTKTPKTISLDVLKQYFAGSLKDAAKSIGVCPTTLKRICRQHGINRWPSRKIKKVGHSLKKLQLVMDSVQGAQGSIQLSSFYSNFPDLSGPNAENAANDATNNQIGGGDLAQDFSSGGNTTTSPCSSSGKTSASSHSFSTGTRSSPVPSTTVNAATTNNSGGDTSATTANDQDLTAAAFLKRARSEAELLVVATHHDQRASALLDRSRSDKSLMVEPTKWANTYHRPDPIPRINTQKPAAEAAAYSAERLSLKVKATFGEENIRLTLTPNMGFPSLQQEIARRFGITDLNKIYIKYLDDDSEWVLMTCDDDLDECIDVNRSSGRHTVKLSVHQATVSLENNVVGFTSTKSR